MSVMNLFRKNPKKSLRNVDKNANINNRKYKNSFSNENSNRKRNESTGGEKIKSAQLKFEDRRVKLKLCQRERKKKEKLFASKLS